MSTQLTDLVRLKREVKRAKNLLDGLQTMLRHAEEAEVRVAKRRPAIPRISKSQWNASISSTPQPLGRIVDKLMQDLSIHASYRRRVVQRCVVFLNGAIKAGDVVKQGPVGNQTYRRAPTARSTEPK